MIAAFSLTGCKEESAEPPAEKEVAEEEVAKELKFGYVCNYMSHQWYQNIIAGMEFEAEAIGGIEMAVADSDLDQNKNISFAEDYITQGVDALIITPVDPLAIDTVIQKAKDANIVLVTEGFVVEGADTYVGIEDYWSGYYGGEKSGEYWVENFPGQTAKVLLVGLPFENACRARVDGFVDGIKASEAEFEVVAEVDGGGMIDQALDVSQDAFTSHPEINMVYGINDDSALGAYEAAKAAGLDATSSSMLICTCGMEGPPGYDAMKDPEHPLKIAICMFPNMVGVGLVDAAYAIVNGETVPDIQFTPTIAVTSDELDEFYSEGAILDIEASKKLPSPERADWWDEEDRGEHSGEHIGEHS